MAVSGGRTPWIMMRALAKDRRDRQPTALALQDELAELARAQFMVQEQAKAAPVPREATDQAVKA